VQCKPPVAGSATNRCSNSSAPHCEHELVCTAAVGGVGGGGSVTGDVLGCACVAVGEYGVCASGGVMVGVEGWVDGTCTCADGAASSPSPRMAVHAAHTNTNGVLTKVHTVHVHATSACVTLVTLLALFIPPMLVLVLPSAGAMVLVVVAEAGVGGASTVGGGAAPVGNLHGSRVQG
jgi:hypothetical protein